MVIGDENSAEQEIFSEYVNASIGFLGNENVTFGFLQLPDDTDKAYRDSKLTIFIHQLGKHLANPSRGDTR